MPESTGPRIDGGSDSESLSTTDAIMLAVYRALATHGYPNLTMAHIADEFDRSKSLLYYHYEGKDELLNDFFTYLCDRVSNTILEESHDDPVEHLENIIDRLLPSEMTDEELQFRRAYFEIRSQAPHNHAYHDQINRSDELLIESFHDAIERGIESGQIRAVEPEPHAEFLLSSIYGIMERGVTLEDPTFIANNREQLWSYVENMLLTNASTQ